MALRVAGIILLAAASLSWRSDRGGRELLRIGLVALIFAEVALRGSDSGTVADIARGIGALGIGACLVGASTRVISARISASSAMVIFAAITVMAVALSAVVSNNIETDALHRYGGRVQVEAQAVSVAGQGLLSSAKVLAVALGTTTDTQTAAALRRITDPARGVIGQADAALVSTQVDRLVALFVKDDDLRRGPTLIVDTRDRAVVTTPPEADQSFVVSLAADPVVTDTLKSQTPNQAVVVVNHRALAVAVQPLVIDTLGFRGALVRTSRLNDPSYLASLGASVAAEEPGTTLAVADQDKILVDGGTKAPAATVQQMAKRALTTGVGTERAIGNRFVAARPVPNQNGALLAVVLSAPRTQEDAARADLFRVLFLVAMGAAAAALALAALAGERIGAGLRRLADAATSIQAGDLGARAQIDTEDELGQLGRSFNSMAASLRDLTADLRTAAVDEAQLRARLEAVVGGMGEALVAVDGDGAITDFNFAAELLLDLPARSARGRAIGDVVKMRSADGTDLTRRLRRPVLEGWVDSGTVRLADAREVPVAISAGTLRGPDNEVTGAVFVLRDERREAELERMKTEFLANISHELRTPLTPIKGFASILETRDLTSAKTRGFASEISVAATQMERVIGQLVNFATIVGGRLSIDPQPVPVRPLVDRTLKPWRARLGTHHKLVRRVDAGVPDVVADSTYLAQAIDELIDNAVKYSPDGGRIVVAAGMAEGEDGPVLEISVSDQGVGIPADRLDSVLQDFTQGDASSTRRFGGLGLGLALVHRIARAHGGELRVASALDDGTTVTMVLPLDGPGTGSTR